MTTEKSIPIMKSPSNPIDPMGKWTSSTLFLNEKDKIAAAAAKQSITSKMNEKKTGIFFRISGRRMVFLCLKKN